MVKEVRVDDMFHRKLKDPKFRALFLKAQKKLEAQEKTFIKKEHKKRGK